jgi:hypothetical protein
MVPILFKIPRKQKNFKPFRGTFGGFFWQGEFSKLAKLLGYFGLYLVPKEACYIRKDIQNWCSAKREVARVHLIKATPSASEQLTGSADYPRVYTQIWRGQKHSSLSPERLEPTLSMELLDHMGACHDATGINLTFLIYELSQRQSPRIFLSAELRKLENLTDQIDAPMLLDAVLMETLCLYSANLRPWPRVAHTTTCLGRYSNLPAGIVISASAYTLGRNCQVFMDPEEWRPERLLEASDVHLEEMRRWFWAFGSGSRKCISAYLAIHSKYLPTYTQSFVLQNSKTNIN